MMAAPFAMPTPRGVEKEDWPAVDVSDLKATIAYIKTLTQQLPEDDGDLMETRRHHSQMVLLIHSLEYAWRERQDFCVGGNQFVYYSAAQAEAVIREVTAEMGVDDTGPVKRQAYRGPDFFVVRGIDGSYPRQKWVVWMEGGRYPDLIIELLSPSTRAKDLGEKKLLYQDIFRTKEYFLFNPFEPYEFHGWCLVNSRYEPIEADGRGWRWSNVIECWLGTWQGMYDQERTAWLRFYDTEGQLVLTGLEAAEQRAQAAEQHVSVVEQRAEAERQRAEAAEAELARLRAQVKRGEDSPTE